MNYQLVLAALIAFIGSLSVLGLLYGIFGNRLFGYSRFEQRTRQVIEGISAVDSSAEDKIKGLASQQRRRRVQEKLKALEQEQKGKAGAFSRAGIQTLLQRAGFGNASVRQFVIFSIVCGVVVTLVFALLGTPWYALIFIGFSATLGLPRWLLNMRVRRRQKKFLLQFSDALDVMVRGVRAGLPLTDCLNIVAREGQEPAKSEFDTLARSLGVGITLPQALQQMHTRLPLSEVNFFAVVLSIQQQSGGNLSEAISNLSNILRERRRMSQKVVSLSQEANYSAGIIGSLPFLIMLIIYFIAPDYITPLFTTTQGNLALLGGIGWMGIGMFVMRSMIRFDI